METSLYSPLLIFSSQNDPLAYLKRAGVQWDRRVRKSLNAMCSELKMASQGQPRISTDRDELLSKWDELSNYTIGKIELKKIHRTSRFFPTIVFRWRDKD